MVPRKPYERLLMRKKVLDLGSERLSAETMAGKSKPKPVQLTTARAATLRSCFATTILRAQQKLEEIDHCSSKAMAAKMKTRETMRVDKERRGRGAKEREVGRLALHKERVRKKARSEVGRLALLRKEREAARLALQKMDATADVEDNVKIMRQLQTLCGRPLSYSSHGCRLFQNLGLTLKHDDDFDVILDEQDEEGEMV